MKMGLLTGLFILLLIFILAGFGSASEQNFSAQEGFDWLYSQSSSSGSFADDAGTTALAILALNSQKYPITSSLEWLESQKSSDNCYPSAGCDTEDTALALIALKRLNEDYSGIEDWFISAQSSSSVTGDFLVEITTESNGTCIFSYERNEQTIEKEVWVSNSYFPEFGNTTFLNLNEDLEANLLTNHPSLDIDIDCGKSTLTGDITITYLYKSSDVYYLFASDTASSAQIKVNNGCFGRTKGGTCSNEVSLYASWALHEIESPLDTKMYLLENYEAGDITQDALLYLITEDASYLDDLTKQQKTDGSFDRDAYKTALAILALEANSGYSTNVDNAKEYLKGKQKDDGSWDSSVETTALVLYSAFYAESVIPSSAEEQPSADTCNYDSVCDEEDGETYSNCPTDCEEEEPSAYPSEEEPECEIDDDCYIGYQCKEGECVEEEEEVCDNDNVCDTGETSGNCANDCGCNDNGKCEPERNENESTCPSDCKETGSAWIIIIIILLIAAAIAGYFIYKKRTEAMPGSQPRAPYTFGSQRTIQKPQQKTSPAPKSRTESELSKSLEEARRLLGK